MSKNNLAKTYLRKLISCFLRNQRFEKGISVDKVHKILVIRNDALGDMLITLPAIAFLKGIAPNASIHVLASQKNYRLIEFDSNVDRVHIAEEKGLKFFRQLFTLRKEKYDVIISTIYVGITKQGFIANIIGGSKAFKSLLYSGEDKYTYYNFQSKLAEQQTPMWEKMYAQFAETFDFHMDTNKVIPYLKTDDNSKLALNKFLIDNHLKPKEYIVLNLSAGQDRNQITYEKYRKIVELIHTIFHSTIVFIHMPKQEKMAQDLSENYTIALPRSDILNIAELIRNSKLCISPDTGIVHLSAAVRTPTIGIFNSEYHSRFWAPYKVPGGKIIDSSNMIFELETMLQSLKNDGVINHG